MSTALTQPRGTWVIETQQPFAPAGLVTMTAGLHDRVQLGVGALWGAFEDEVEGALMVTGKLQLMRGRHLAIAVQGGAMAPAEDDDDEVGLLGVVASACLDGDDCRWLASGHLSAVLGAPRIHSKICYDYGDCYRDETAVPIVGGGSLLAGRRTKLVLEIEVGDDQSNQFETHPVFLLYSGVRFARPGWSFDAGVAAAADENELTPVPVPLFAFALRR